MNQTCAHILNEIIEWLDHTPPPEEAQNLVFIEAIWPWMEAARRRLQQKAARQLSLLSSKAYLAMEISLAKRWSQLCAHTMHLCLDIERISFTLQGATPRDRYLNFIEKRFFNATELRSFFEEYQELGRFAAQFLHLWVEQTAEFLQHLEQDLPLLEKTFHQGQSLGQVKTLSLNAGDIHQNGRSVSIVTFESSISVIYKPKNLNIVKKFHSFLRELNQLGLQLILKDYIVLPREDYGWEQKVEHLPCQSLVEVEHYFERAGMLLCLMDLFKGSDIHFENIIASGEHPILIDLETIFCSRLKSQHPEKIDDMMNHSVLTTGLLPQFQFGKQQQKGIDLAGLDGIGQEALQFLKWENLGTDEIEYGYIKRGKQVACNQVIYNGQVKDAKEHIDAITRGFQTMYLFIESHNAVVKKWLFSVEKDPVRLILRSTGLYNYIFYKICSNALRHPDLVKKELEILDVALLRSSYPYPLIEEEKKALLQGDIPCFHTLTSSVDLYSQSQLIAIECLEYPALQQVLLRLDNMGRSDQKLQETFIKHAFYAVSVPVHHFDGSQKMTQESAIPTKEEILSQAIDIAKDLRKRAFASEDDSLGWISLEPNLNTEQYQLVPISDTLYSGRLGIALFFAALKFVTGDPQWAIESINTLKPLRKKIAQGNSNQIISSLGIGGMTGAGAMIYGLLQIGRLLHFPVLAEEALTVIRSIEEKHILADTHYDLMAGSAGLILALLLFYRYSPEPSFIKLASSCGEHLCRNAKEINGGFGWETIDNKCFLGLSHGTAGIATALFKLANINGNSRFFQTASKALIYERSHYCAEKKNWPHLSKENHYVCSWCHGATGIGLSRLSLSSFISDPLLSQEIEAALNTTCSQEGPNDLILCCGLLGRLAFLHQAAKSRIHLAPVVKHSIGVLFHQMQQGGKEEFYNPGLMQGKAGLGFTLLHLLDEEKYLPQVLLLE